MVDSHSALSIAQLIESDGPGGAETILLTLSEGLSAQGHNVVSVVPEPKEGWLQERLKDRGQNLEFVSVRAPFDLQALLDLRRALDTYRVDVVHAHEFTMAVYGALACAGRNVALVVTMHGGDYYKQRARRRLALRFAVFRTGALVAVSESTAKCLRSNLHLSPRNVDVIYNGVQVQSGSGQHIRDKLRISSQVTLLLAVGNLYRVKGHHVLLHALAGLSEGQRDKICLAIAGRGVERQRLEATARDLNIDGIVNFLGYRKDVPDLLAAADVFVLPSQSEGLPLALLEAMGLGLPVVASAVGGIPELVEDGVHGLLVPPDDPEALTSALNVILADDALRGHLGAAARLRARKLFSVKSMVSRYENLYRAVLESHRYKC